MTTEKHWVNDTQIKYFKKEITDFSNKKNIERNSNFYPLNYMLNENRILDLKGMLELGNFSESANTPD